MSLIFSRRFLPLFLTQFLGAFNDNLFRGAVTLMLLFHLSDAVTLDPGLVVTAASGIFVLPFFLFSATAGQLAEKFDKAHIARYVKVFEILFMMIATAGFLLPHVGILLAVVFLMGTHSAFFGPVKYATLPQHLEAEELLSGNAWVEAGTFVAIPLGTVLAGILSLHGSAIYILPVACIFVAIMGLIVSLKIPPALGYAPELKIDWRFWRATGEVLSMTRRGYGVWRHVLAISWFWLLGSVYLAQIPILMKSQFDGDEGTVTLALALFSAGIAAGSLLCGRLFRGEVRTTWAPYMALAMMMFGVNLQSDISFTRAMIDIFMIAVAGGFFVVPLYAAVQRAADPRRLSRTIAGLNIMNALFMVLAAVISGIMLALSFSVNDVLLVAACGNIFVALLTFTPQNSLS
jgi:acyl-[acyl-carrier-protein]-phospholipid O-acyltransferase/long-chain-fatty-acid--[acyl-carrier-protein] ligase